MPQLSKQYRAERTIQMKNSNMHPVGQGKRYAAPSLKVYGGVLELTAAGTQGGKESGPNVNSLAHDNKL